MEGPGIVWKLTAVREERKRPGWRVFPPGKGRKRPSLGATESPRRPGSTRKRLLSRQGVEKNGASAGLEGKPGLDFPARERGKGKGRMS